MPQFGPDISSDNVAYIDDSARLYGKISLGRDASVWPYVVMRAEINEIRIGARTNIQDFVMIHVGYDTSTVVGEDCSIAHHATLHGCEIGDRCLIGINSTVMDNAKIGKNSIVAGNAIVREGSEFPDNAVIAGIPAKQVATLDNPQKIIGNARFYSAIAKLYATGKYRLADEELRNISAEFGL